MSGHALASFAPRPGTSPLHRAPVPAKLALTGVSTLLIAVVDSPVADAAGVVLAVVVHALARLPVRDLARCLVPALWFVVPLLAYLAWVGRWRDGVSSGTDVLATVALAAAVSTTTSPAAFLDTVEAALTRVVAVPWLGRLLRRAVDPQRAALTVALALASIPAVARCAEDARQAALARGLERSIRARTTPAVTRSIGHAFRMAEALAARGLGD